MGFEVMMQEHAAFYERMTVLSLCLWLCLCGVAVSWRKSKKKSLWAMAFCVCSIACLVVQFQRGKADLTVIDQRYYPELKAYIQRRGPAYEELLREKLQKNMELRYGDVRTLDRTKAEMRQQSRWARQRERAGARALAAFDAAQTAP